ncbi:uncharacterized protein CEXT_210371 [Caerostris extrusa]|uniref:Uncharacterized protein n=1 Tax=Caerostris extrusa TaxID=172846 RepID=A0AAV4SPB0_CAEEX|nr:uncharacterized protein CEXT_210371 [Caerostris extrusa]
MHYYQTIHQHLCTREGRKEGESKPPQGIRTWKWKDQPPQFNSVLPHFGNYLLAPTTAKPIAPYLHRDVTRPLGCVTHYS